MSESAKTMNGALPPSSAETRRTRSELRAMRCLPMASEPVNESLRRRGSESNGSVTSSVDDTTTLSTPGGRPAFRRMRASASEDSGVSAEGRWTTVQPAASAAAMLRAGTASGKFQGVITRVGPTGSFITMC